MINLFYYFSYSVYKFYERKGEKNPEVYSFFAPIALLMVNVLSIIGFLHLYVVSILTSSANKYYVIVFVVAFGMINYFLLYREQRFKEVFTEIEKRSNDEKKRLIKYMSRLYVLVSGIVLIVMLILSDLSH